MSANTWRWFWLEGASNPGWRAAMHGDVVYSDAVHSDQCLVMWCVLVHCDPMRPDATGPDTGAPMRHVRMQHNKCTPRLETPRCGAPRCGAPPCRLRHETLAPHTTQKGARNESPWAPLVSQTGPLNTDFPCVVCLGRSWVSLQLNRPPRVNCRGR